jgi:hypothetical protein
LSGLWTAGITQDNNFLIVYQTILEKVGMLGQLKWTVQLESGIAEVFPDGSDLLAICPVSGGLDFVSFDSQGNRLSSYIQSGYPASKFLRAPDGTLRAIFNLGASANYRAPQGFLLSSLSVSGLAQPNTDSSATR